MERRVVRHVASFFAGPLIRRIPALAIGALRGLLFFASIVLGNPLRKYCAGFLFISLLINAVPAAAAEPSAGEVQSWSNFYYQNPRPDETPRMLQYMSKNGILTRPNNVGNLMGFLSGLFAKNSDKIELWLRDIDSYSPAEQKLLLTAAWMSGTPGSQRLLRSIGQAKVSKLAGGDLSGTPSGRDIPIRQPVDLDFYWGRFFVTGDAHDVEKIIAVLYLAEVKPELPGGKIDGMPLMIGMAARWSLQSNAMQHPRVLEVCKSALGKQTGANRRILVEVIRAAERKRASMSSLQSLNKSATWRG